MNQFVFFIFLFLILYVMMVRRLKEKFKHLSKMVSTILNLLIDYSVIILTLVIGEKSMGEDFLN